MYKKITLLFALMLSLSANAAFHFEIFNITTSSAVVITHSDDSKVGYINSFLDLETYNKLTEAEIAQEFKKYMDQYGSNYEGMATFGNDSSLIKGLDENTEYVVYAYPLNMSTGLAAAKFDTAHFTTATFHESDNQLSLSYSATNDEISVKTTNSDTYFIYIDPLSYYTSKQSNFSDASITKQLEGWASTMTALSHIDQLTLSGDQNLSVQWCFSVMYFNLKPQVGEEYIAMAIPYMGAVNGKPTYLIFTYGEEEIADANVNVNANGAAATKVMRNGMLLLQRNGETYTVSGQRL